MDPRTGYARTAAALRSLLGLAAPDGEFLGLSVRFGYFGTSITVVREHISLLEDLNASLREVPPIFDAGVVRRWRTVNELLIYHFARKAEVPGALFEQFAGLATISSFPLLEEIARRVSGAWDETGRLLRDIPEAVGLTRGTPPNTRPESYRAGKRVALLEHKLMIMRTALREDLRATLDSLSAVIASSAPPGLPGSALYERLSFIRNDWLHGTRDEGWEALLVTFLLAMIYFPTAAEPEHITDPAWRAQVDAPAV